MKKVAIVIGHTEKDKGAYSRILKKSEFDFFKDLENELAKIGDVFEHNPEISSYTRRQIDTAKKTVTYDIVFELHFNSFNKIAHGCEALYHEGSIKGMELAKKFCKTWNKKTGIVVRGAVAHGGAVAIGKGGRGEMFLKKTKHTAVLLEPFFGDNQSDCAKWDKEKFIETLKEICN
jgi:N-acetylmuramoyl-L-alanine amidase